MSGGFPFLPGLCNGKSIGAGTGLFVNGGTNIAPSATANTKGSWTQLTASCPIDADMIEISIVCAELQNTELADAVDIGIGSSGNEIVIFNNLMAVCQSRFTNPRSTYVFPCSIPAGTRISARSQSIAASGGGVYMSIRVFQTGFQGQGGASGVDAIGFNAAATTGVAITPGNGAKGSWTQIVASSSVDYAGLAMCIDNGPASSSAIYLIDVGIGGSGSEQIIVPDVLTGNNYGQLTPPPTYMVPIPAGSRIAVRADDVSSGSGVSFGITIYGIYR